MRMKTRLAAACLSIAPLLAAAPVTAHAQWSTVYEQFYMPGDFNWTFRRTYPAADRLFNAFDYGHAILYERLYNNSHADPAILEQREYDFITKKLLVSPPRVPLEETAIEVQYAKLAPEAKMMFDWAHLLHRQIYDVLASEGLTLEEKDAQVAKLVKYYKTRPGLAFSSVPKNMDLMEGQPYSLEFRNRYPKFNGLIWGYHWLQVGLYEPLMVGKNLDERQAGVGAAVARFRQMLEGAPENMPRIMPMTAAVAPTFAARYQEAAIIFDNLHSMHDVVSDILASDKVPHNKKRDAILTAAARYRDATSYAMTPKEWMDMAQMMGIENMGGSAVGILPGWPKPTIARGAPASEAMRGMSHPGTDMAHKPDSDMASMDHSQMAGRAGDSTASKSDTAHANAAGTSMPGMDMSAGQSKAGVMPAHSDSTMAAMMELHTRMLADPTILKRVMADTALHRLMLKTATKKPIATKKATAAKPPAKATPAKKPPVKRPVPAKKPMNHGSMPGMRMPGDTSKQS